LTGLIDSGDILKLRRRFVKDQASQKTYYIKRQMRLDKMRQIATSERKERREHQVTLYRKYRIGELPDIQIKFSCIIAPLQALAQLDSVVARQLFSSLFNAIFAELDAVKSEREVNDLMTSVSRALNNLLCTSAYFYRPFIASVLVS
jgi:DNA-dependent protein kinase catalytic subunit